MNLSILGFVALAAFMLLVLTKRVSAVAALIIVPIVFGIIAGSGPGLGEMMLKGVAEVSPTLLMLLFAMLYFAVMIEAGLFEPLVRRILAFTGDDPVRVVVGTAVLAILVSLDGDGATTVIVTVSAMYPVYRRLGLNPLIIALLLGLISPIINWLPWGGPAARAALALRIDVMDVVTPLLPAMGLTLLGILGLAYGMGRSERRRLAAAPAGPGAIPGDIAEETPASPKQTRNLWLNLGLTLALIVGMVTGIAPLPALVMGAFAVAVTLNFPRLSEQKAVLAVHGENVLLMVSLIFGAGAFTGILSGTGMIDAMGGSLVSAIPPELGRFMGPITALVSMPLLVFMSNDAFFFGVVPVLSAAGAAHGVPPEVIARASLMGMPLHSLSPFIAPIYLVASLLRADVGELQRFALPWALLCSIFATAAAMLTGAIVVVG